MQTRLATVLLIVALPVGCDQGEDTTTHDALNTEVWESEWVPESLALSEQDEPAQPYAGGWTMGTPQEHGLSTDGLQNMANVAETLGSNCMVVIHHGVLVGEWYWNGYDATTRNPDVFSVTKSVASALFGVADYQGLLSVDDRVSDYVPEWRNTPSENVTIRQLLVHDSGRTFDLGLEWAIPSVFDQTAYALAVGQSAEPGTSWTYSNLGYQALEAVLDVVLGGNVDQFANEELFAPIGMTAQLGHDPSGNVTLYSGISASCLDLARLGHLYQRHGQWNGQRILDLAWVNMSTEVANPLNDAYGVGWWLNNPGHVILPMVQDPFEYDGQFLPSAPASTYTAFGAFGNFVSVDPDGYILVRLTDQWDLNDVLSLGDVDAIWAAFQGAKL